MSEKRASLEMIAPSVEEAMTRALEELGLSAEDVDMEVLDPGSRGLFGLGSRQARIRLTVKGSAVVPPVAEEGESEALPWPLEVPTSAAPTPAVSVPAAPVVSEPLEVVAERPAAVPVQPKPAAGRAAAERIPAAPERMPAMIPLDDAPLAATENQDQDEVALRVGRETVSELLEKMKIQARVSARYGSPDDPHSKPPVLVDVNGDDLSILIGPKAETLNALQYIASLIVSKELGKSIPLVVDVQGYRMRREQQIRQLARRMADQAIKTGRRQVLEPMPANERRLIHIELRANPNVTTESIGEEPRRKVTVIPRR